MQSFFCTGLDSRVFDDDSVLGKSRYLLQCVVNVTAGLIPVRLPEQTFLSEPYYKFKACHVCDTQLKAGDGREERRSPGVVAHTAAATCVHSAEVDRRTWLSCSVWPCHGADRRW